MACSCDSRALFHAGCTCGEFKRERTAKNPPLPVPWEKQTVTLADAKPVGMAGCGRGCKGMHPAQNCLVCGRDWGNDHADHHCIRAPLKPDGSVPRGSFP